MGKDGYQGSKIVFRRVVMVFVGECLILGLGGVVFRFVVVVSEVYMVVFKGGGGLNVGFR